MVSIITLWICNSAVLKSFSQWQLTLSQPTDFRFFQAKDFAYDNFKVDGNGRTFFKRVENTVGKGEIACYKQFLLFPQCFQKSSTADK